METVQVDIPMDLPAKPKPKPKKIIQYRVKHDESLLAVAYKFGTSEKMLRKLNDLVGDFEPEVDSILSILVDADKEYQDVESP